MQTPVGSGDKTPRCPFLPPLVCRVATAKLAISIHTAKRWTAVLICIISLDIIKKSLEKGLGDNTKLYVKQKSYSLRDAFNDYKVHPEALDSYFEY